MTILRKRFFRDAQGIADKSSGLHLLDPFKSKKVLDFEYYDIKELNERLNVVIKDKKEILGSKNNVIFYPNVFGRLNIIGSAGIRKEDVPILESTYGQRLRFYFLDEIVRSDIRSRLLVVDDFYVYMGSIDYRFGYIYSKEKLDEKKQYLVKAMLVPFSDKVGTKKVVNNVFFIIKAEEYTEDFSSVSKKRIDSILDLCPVRDFDNNIPIYSKVETMLIRTGLTFMKESVPALNLILCGGTGSKKTAWFDSFRIIHGDDYSLSQWSTTKGLIVSHYGDNAKAGLLFRANFVAMVDEFFRRFRGDIRGTNSLVAVLKEGLGDFMNIVEHKQFPFPSGKGIINLTLRSSFMATDNAIYKESIPKVWEEDKAVLRRFTFLNVSDETALKGSSMMRPPDSNEAMKKYEKFLKDKNIFRDLKQMAKFDRYCRMGMSSMELSKKETDYINGIMEEQMRIHKHSFYLNVPVTVLYISCRFHAKHINDVDMDLFEKCVDRLFNDAHNVLMPENRLKWKNDS